LAEAEGLVKEHSSVALANITLRGGAEGVPTLQDVLSVIDGQVPVLIEIKDQDGQMGEGVGPLERSVAAALSGYSGPVAVMSFNPNSVKLMAALLPDVPRGLVTDAFVPTHWDLPENVCAPLRKIEAYEAVGATFISHDCRDLERARVAELKASGADILCWTVRSPQQEAQARKIAENITFESYLAPLGA
jgi:glycerophosphoryl diester phosphodiesterase